MTREAFLRELEGQMEIPPGSLSESRALADVAEWDSLAAVLFIALADEKAGVTVSGKQIASTKTFDELLSLLGDRLSAS